MTCPGSSRARPAPILGLFPSLREPLDCCRADEGSSLSARLTPSSLQCLGEIRQQAAASHPNALVSITSSHSHLRDRSQLSNDLQPSTSQDRAQNNNAHATGGTSQEARLTLYLLSALHKTRDCEMNKIAHFTGDNNNSKHLHCSSNVPATLISRYY